MLSQRWSYMIRCVSLPTNRLYFNLLLVFVSLYMAAPTVLKNSELLGAIGGSKFSMLYLMKLHEFICASLFLKELQSRMHFVCWTVRCMEFES